MALECKTKFGSIFVEEMPMSEYALMDSNQKVMQYYDNDMPLRWLSDDTFTKIDNEQTFFDTLAQLVNCFLMYDKDKSNLIERVLKEGYTWLVSEIEDEIFKVGNHFVFIDCEGEY